MKKTALITGTSTGIGYHLAKGLVEKNYQVIGTSRSGNAIDVEEVEMLQLDVSEEKSMQACVEQIHAMDLKLDILINNAGIGPDLGKSKPDSSSFSKTFAVNVQGLVFFNESLVELIQPGGRLINVSSKLGSLANNSNRHSSTAYCMSKAAVNMYTKHLANRLEGKVKVACIHPGWVQTAINGYTPNAPLTGPQSAEKILRFLDADFKQGIFWDVEDWVELAW